MREQRSIQCWTEDLRQASDEDVLRVMFDLADEISCLHRRSGELVLRLDHLAVIVGDRWAPDAMARLEEQERAEIERERRR